MPFTLAHPAAVIPLYRKLGRFGVLSALVAGSMAPDMHYFLPFQFGHEATHSLLGMIWFCMPAGFILYLAFHLLLKRPVFSLLPDSMATRLAPFVSPCSLLPKVPWTGVIVSLSVGVVTHVLWDSLTHGAIFGTDFQQILLFTFAESPVSLLYALQIASSVAGLWLLTRWLLRWMSLAPPHKFATPSMTSARWRVGVLLCIFCLPALTAVTLNTDLSADVSALAILPQAAVTIVSTVAISLFVYSFAWHIGGFHYELFGQRAMMILPDIKFGKTSQRSISKVQPKTKATAFRNTAIDSFLRANARIHASSPGNRG